MKKAFLLAAALFFCLQFTFSQAGNTDASFGLHGVVTTNFNNNIRYNSTADQVLVQADGSMYIIFEATGRTLITKRLADGSADQSFGSKGFAFSGTFSNSHAVLQPNGKLVLAGSVLTLISTDSDDGEKFASDFGIARFNSDGSLDNSFGTNGKVITDFGGVYTGTSDYDVPTSVAIAGDGKIVVAGYSIDDNGNSDFALARYEADGNPDKAFNSDGKQIFDLGYSDDLSSVAIQNDGKIVIAGGAPDLFDDFLLMRLNADGSLDSSFSGHGKQFIDFGFTDVATSVAIQSDGKIVVCGGAVTSDQTNQPNDFAVARCNTDGSLDSTFSNDGKQTTGFGSDNNTARSIVIQPDGKILLAGSALVRYNVDGSLDNTFGTGGKQVSDFEIFSAAIQNDGRILSAGSHDNGAYTDFALTRSNTNGKPDKSFANNGTLSDYYTGGSTIYNSSAVQSDGKIIAAGSVWNRVDFDCALARYNSDGTLDNTFNKNGKLITDLGFNESITSAAIQNDGKIVTAGNSVNGTVTTYFLARFNADGSPDNTFGVDGKQAANFAFSIVRLQKDGKIVTGGAETLARYDSNGTLDASFNGTGKVDTLVKDFAFQQDEKILLINGGFKLVRYNTDGSLDNTFVSEEPDFFPGFDPDDPNNIYKSPNSGANSIAIESDGKIAVGGFAGFYNRYNQTYDNVVVRYNADGSLDHTFSEIAYKFVVFKTFSKNNSIALSNDNRIVINGMLYNNVHHDGTIDEMLKTGFGIARINNDGSIDSTFGKEGIIYPEPENEIQNINIANNKLYAAGYRNKGDTAGLLIRYLLDNNTNTQPTVTLTAPANNATYLAPVMRLKLSAAASDADGTITKVEFYNGNTLLHTETVIPYGYVWKNIPLGNYTLTAKAYDNSGNVTASAPVHISVGANKAPVVSIVKPVNNQSFAAPAYIHFEAAASDTDGRIAKVEFYSGAALLRTEFTYPYTYVWKNVPAGAYTITAKATDNFGAQTTSAAITVKVTSASAIVADRAYSKTGKTASNDALTLRLSPNPAGNIVNIYTSGLQQNKPATLSIISAAGIVLKTIPISNAASQIDVSALVSSVYTIKIVSGNKVTFTRFVKL